MRRKKCCAVLLVLLCIALCLPGLPAGAADKTELLDNGGFERTFSDGTPGAWIFSDKENTGVQSTGGYENSAYLQLGGTSSNYALQSIAGIRGGGAYTFSAYIRTASPAKAILKIEWYARENGALSAISPTEYVFSDASSAWKTLSIQVTAPDGAVYARLLIRKMGSGAVCWDAVSLVGAYEKQMVASTDFKPPVQGAVEAFRNGGFEEITDGEAVRWDKSSGLNFSLETVRPFSGTTSFLIEGNDTNEKPWIRQVYTGAEGGSMYQLSCWVASYIKEGYFSFKLEFYNSTACSAATAISNVVSGGCLNTDGVWKQVVIPIRTPDTCKSIAVYPRFYGGVGRVYIDELSLYQTEKNSPLSLNTDAIFYYSDRTEDGVATVESTPFYTDGSTSEVEFSLLDAAGAVKKKETVSFVNEKAEFSFPLSLLETEQSEYTVRARALIAGRTAVWERTVPVYKYPRPGMLDKEGNCIVDGEIFTPVISYHHHPRDYDKAAAMGVNVVQSYGMTGTAILDEAAKYNIKVLMILYEGMKPAGHPENIEKTRALVSEVKDHPALFGYAVMDEPYYNYTAPEDWLFASYKTIRDIDSYHPVYVCENTREHLAQSQKYVDVLGIDPYIADKSDEVLTLVYDETVFAVENTEPGKPVYALLQAFDFKGYFPTGEELRHQMYQAFMGGAKGVGYFAFNDSKDGKKLSETELWNSICDFTANELEPAIYGFAQDTACTKQLGTNVDAAWWNKGEETTLLLLNHTDSTQTGTLSLAGLTEGADVAEILGDGIGTLNGTSFTYHIGGSSAVRFTLCKTDTPWNGNLFTGSSDAELSIIEKTVYNLREGERYSLHFRAKCSDPAKAPRLRLTFSNTSSSTAFSSQVILSGADAVPSFGTTDWQSYEITFRVPEGADTVTLLLGSVAGGVYASPQLLRETQNIFFYSGADVKETACAVTETVRGTARPKTYYLAAIRGERKESAAEATGFVYRKHEAEGKMHVFVPLYTQTEKGCLTLVSAELRYLEKGEYACILQPIPSADSPVFGKTLLVSAAGFSPLSETETFTVK